MTVTVTGNVNGNSPVTGVTLLKKGVTRYRLLFNEGF